MDSFSSDQFVADYSNTVLPAGVYTVGITEATYRPLKSGKGKGIYITYQVIDGPHARHRVWSTLNVIHDSPEAQHIGQSNLRKLCDVCGGVVITESTTQLLVGKTLRVRVKIRVDEKYGESNEVVGFEAAPGQAAKRSASAMQTTGLNKPAPWANT